jgi:hypothetical protein
MHSKQLNFYLTANDQAALLTRLRRNVGDFTIVESITERDEPHPVKSAAIKRMGVDRLKLYLARSDDIGAIELNVLSNQPHKTLNVVRSPVVEFIRCYHADGRLRRGRMYFVTAYYDERVLFYKERAFLDWATALIVTARKGLKRDPSSSGYVGEEARRLKETGEEFVI